MEVTLVEGDLLKQSTDCLVNPWNQNIIPWWLLIPSGVSGAIKQQAGFQPFIELGKLGPIPLGNAVVTSAGRLPFKCLVHVVSINMLWRASEYSIRNSVLNAMKLAEQASLRSIAFPILGAGAGGFNAGKAESLMLEAFHQLNSPVQVTLVRYKKD